MIANHVATAPGYGEGNVMLAALTTRCKLKTAETTTVLDNGCQQWRFIAHWQTSRTT